MAKRAPRQTRKPPLTRWGRFLQDERVRADRTQRETFDHFRRKYADLFDWSDDSVTAYGNLERGTSEPNEAQQRAFLTEYGHDALPTEPDQAGSAAPDPMTMLADAITLLTAELRDARDERTKLQARVEEMDSVLRGLVGPTIAAGAEPTAHPHSVGSGR